MVESSPKRAQRATLNRDGDHVELSDLDTAAFFLANKVAILEAYKVTKYKFRFRFYDPRHLCEGLAMAFINSCCHDFADAVCRIKKALHKFTGRGETQKNGQGGRIVIDS